MSTDENLFSSVDYYYLLHLEKQYYVLQKNKKSRFLLGNKDFIAFFFSSKWYHQESNRGHKDFQSFALPTELWHLSFVLLSLFLDCDAKVRIIFKLPNIW